MKYFMVMLLRSCKIDCVVYTHYLAHTLNGKAMTWSLHVHLLQRPIVRKKFPLRSADEIIQIGHYHGPTPTAQFLSHRLLSLLPKRQCLPQPRTSLIGYFHYAAAPPTLVADPDQSLSFKWSQVSRQCRTIHAHEFGELGNRSGVLVANGDQHGELGGAKAGRPQYIVIQTSHRPGRHPRPMAQAAVVVQFSLQVRASRAYTLYTAGLESRGEFNRETEASCASRCRLFLAR